MAAAFQRHGAAAAISSTNTFDSKIFLISSRRSLSDSERKASFLVVRPNANSKGRRNDQLVAKAITMKADSATASTTSKPGGIHANFSAFRHRGEIKKVSCLHLLKSFSSKNFEPKTPGHIDDDPGIDQIVKLGRRGKVIDQLMELPIEQQIYDMVDVEGSKGLTSTEYRLGVDYHPLLHSQVS